MAAEQKGPQQEEQPQTDDLGDADMEAAEYEFLNEAAAGGQRGDTQALAPATEEQAAGAHLPDQEAAAEDNEVVDAGGEDEMVDDFEAPQQGAQQVMLIAYC